MAENIIEVDTRMIDNDKKSVTLCLSKINQNLSDMHNSVLELDATWDGIAKQAFQYQFNEDYQMLTEITKFMKEFTSCMEYASKEYTKCENSVCDLVQAINI